MKKLLLWLIPSLALTQGIKFSPTAPTVSVGSSITINTDRPVYFQLRGSGQIQTTYGSSTTYTAPPVLGPQHVLNGCMVGPNDTVFNTPVDHLPVSANSTTWATYATSNPIAVTYTWGTNVVDRNAPTTPQTFYYSSLLNGTPFPIPALPNKKRETGAYTTDGMNDHHMLVVNHNSCQFFETYQQGVPNTVCPSCTAASGYTYSSSSYARANENYGGGSTDAAGLPLAPLTLHLSEIKAGAIQHALRFTACGGCISSSYVWPAVYSTGGQPSAPPMGTRFRLKANFDVATFPPSAQIVLNALKQYGMILADIGISGQISASTDVTEDPAIVRDLQSIQAAWIAPSNFEAVDESSLQLNVDSIAVNPMNGYVAPRNQALLTMIDASNGSNTVSLPIALEAVTVGTPDPTMVVQAGTPGFPISAWVNGSSNTGLVWSLTPTSGAGSISQNGTFTAPAMAATPIEATITATSAADATASTSISLTILPPGPIRIDTGSAVPTIDDSGNPWLPDLGFETGSFNALSDNYPTGAWGAIPNATQTESYMYTWGDDIAYRMHLPNGNYDVVLTFGEGGCSGTFSPGPIDNGLVIGALNLEAQGKIVYSGWNFASAVRYACRTPVSVTMPAMVRDTNLRFALRATGGNNVHSAPELNSVSIQSDNASPYLVLQAPTNVVNPGSALQLTVIPWFLQNPSLRWQILSGPGTISSTGLYMPPATMTKGAFVEIKALAIGTQACGYFGAWIPPSPQ